jgi:hypothetical protein
MPSLKQTALTKAGAAGALGGIVIVPLQAPPVPAAICAETGGSVVAATATKSCDDDTNKPGEHPVPLIDATVPGGPLVGDIEKFATPASAVEGIPTTSASTASSAIRYRRGDITVPGASSTLSCTPVWYRESRRRSGPWHERECPHSHLSSPRRAR